MERGYVVALLHFVDNFGGDEHTLVELFAAVHHAVTHGIDFGKRSDATLLGIGEEIEYCAHSTFVVGIPEVENLF